MPPVLSSASSPAVPQSTSVAVKATAATGNKTVKILKEDCAKTELVAPAPVDRFVKKTVISTTTSIAITTTAEDEGAGPSSKTNNSESSKSTLSLKSADSKGTSNEDLQQADDIEGKDKAEQSHTDGDVAHDAGDEIAKEKQTEDTKQEQDVPLPPPPPPPHCCLEETEELLQKCFALDDALTVLQTVWRKTEGANDDHDRSISGCAWDEPKLLARVDSFVRENLMEILKKNPSVIDTSTAQSETSKRLIYYIADASADEKFVKSSQRRRLFRLIAQWTSRYYTSPNALSLISAFSNTAWLSSLQMTKSRTHNSSEIDGLVSQPFVWRIPVPPADASKSIKSFPRQHVSPLFSACGFTWRLEFIEVAEYLSTSTHGVTSPSSSTGASPPTGFKVKLIPFDWTGTYREDWQIQLNADIDVLDLTDSEDGLAAPQQYNANSVYMLRKKDFLKRTAVHVSNFATSYDDLSALLPKESSALSSEDEEEAGFVKVEKEEYSPENLLGSQEEDPTPEHSAETVLEEKQQNEDAEAEADEEESPPPPRDMYVVRASLTTNTILGLAYLHYVDSFHDLLQQDKRKALLDLPLDSLRRIISSNYLSVDNEMEVLQLVISWIEYNMQKEDTSKSTESSSAISTMDIETLLSQVRVSQISVPDLLSAVNSSDVLRKSKSFKEMLTWSLHGRTMHRPRLSYPPRPHHDAVDELVGWLLRDEDQSQSASPIPTKRSPQALRK